MDRVVLDTDASSLSLKHRLPPSILTRIIGKQPCVTFVTLGELTQWAELRRWGRRNPDALGNWFGGGVRPPPNENTPPASGRSARSPTPPGAAPPPHYPHTPPAA